MESKRNRKHAHNHMSMKHCARHIPTVTAHVGYPAITATGGSAIVWVAQYTSRNEDPKLAQAWATGTAKALAKGKLYRPIPGVRLLLSPVPVVRTELVLS